MKRKLKKVSTKNKKFQLSFNPKLLYLIPALALICVFAFWVRISRNEPQKVTENITPTASVAATAQDTPGVTEELEQTVEPSTTEEYIPEEAKLTFSYSGRTISVSAKDSRYKNRSIAISFSTPKTMSYYYSPYFGMIEIYASENELELAKKLIKGGVENLSNQITSLVDLRIHAYVNKSDRHPMAFFPIGYDENLKERTVGTTVVYYKDDSSGVNPMREYYFVKDVIAYKFTCFYDGKVSLCDELVGSISKETIIGDKSVPVEDTNVANWKLYSSKAYKFSFKAPETWRTVGSIEPDAINDGFFGLGPKDIYEDVSWGVNIYSAKSTTEDLIIKAMGSQFGSARREVRKQVKINGYSATEVIVTTTTHSDWEAHSFIVKNEGALIVLSGDDVGDYKFMNLVNSFKLLN